MKRMKRILTAVMASALLLTCGAFMTIPAAAKDVSVSNGTGTREAQFITGDTAYRAKINTPFTGFGFSMPTWATNNGSCRLSMYEWKGTYRDTIKAEPIATKLFENMKDNATNWVTFDQQPAGEYLFRITEPSGTIGLWIYLDPVNPYGFLYKGGAEQLGDPQLSIRFPGAVKDPFDVCEPSVDPIDGKHTPPAEAVTPEDSILVTHEVMPDTWVFTDGLGRVSLTNAEVGDPKDDKTVAMFFWTWHLGGRRATPLNVTEFIKKYPEAIRDYDHAAWPSGVAYYWNESVYGYYLSTDAWVLRKQGELLANAGVDAVLTDNTNGTFTWQDGYQALLEAWGQARTVGAVNTPKLSFMLPFSGGANTASQLRDIYQDIYRTGDYHDQWFYWDGKPVIMAHGTNSGLDKNDNLDKEILNFFTFRPGYAGYTNSRVVQGGQWGWLSIYPQPLYCATKEQARDKKPEQVTVGVAMNHSYEYDLIAPMNGIGIMGRSYTHDNETRFTTEGDEASKWGYNLAEQFEYAIEADPRLIFVTGWNEWTAGRHETWPEGYASAVENAFPDQFNDEFSRDIEPTKGVLKDHYYYQLVNYVRQYKGARPIPAPTVSATIDITKDNTQWNEVGPYYAAYIGGTEDRDATGAGGLLYTEYSGRNDIIGARVARDGEFVYFYVECNENITPYTDPLWMVLYIDSDQANQGWESFDYVLNKTSPTATTATLEKFTGNGYETEKVGDVEYTVDGKYMQVKVPKTMLNLSGYDFTINFSWTDNVHDEDDAAPAGDTAYKYTKFSGDILDFYMSGDVAPGGRFKFSYISTAENAGVPADTEAPTETPTEPAETPAESDTPAEDAATEAPTDAPAETDAPKGGCKSSVGMGMAAVATAMAAAVVMKKKED